MRIEINEKDGVSSYFEALNLINKSKIIGQTRFHVKDAEIRKEAKIKRTQMIRIHKKNR